MIGERQINPVLSCLARQKGVVSSQDALELLGKVAASIIVSHCALTGSEVREALAWFETELEETVAKMQLETP